MLSVIDTMLVQTDGQTRDDSIHRASIASRGKNHTEALVSYNLVKTYMVSMTLSDGW